MGAVQDMFGDMDAFIRDDFARACAVLEEQQARIDDLRRQAEKENTGKEPITVVMGEELEEYCV